MPLSLAEFRKIISAESEADLKQRFTNCRMNPRYSEYAEAAKQELDARFQGWDKPHTRRGGSRATTARFRGQAREFDTARAAYIWLVECFAAANPTLFTDIRWETTGYVAVGRRSRGAARNYFAKSPTGLFRRTPSLTDNPNNFRKLTNGWFVNLNLNTRENFEILCRFATVSKLRHGEDWDWEVLDPAEPLSDARHRAVRAEELQQVIDEIFRNGES